MSGPMTPNGPSNPGSLASTSIPRALDDQQTESVDTFTQMFPDPLPARITRIERAKNAGTIGLNQLDAAHPNSDNGYIPHQYTPRRPVTVTPFDKTIDVTVTVPAIYVGDPLH